MEEATYRLEIEGYCTNFGDNLNDILFLLYQTIEFVTDIIFFISASTSCLAKQDSLWKASFKICHQRSGEVHVILWFSSSLTSLIGGRYSLMVYIICGQSCSRYIF